MVFVVQRQRKSDVMNDREKARDKLRGDGFCDSDIDYILNPIYD